MSVAGAPGDDSLGFFLDQSRAFNHTLQVCRGGADLYERLSFQAFDSFEGNVAIQAEGQPPLDCDKGCAACCILRVTATAPEVLLVARFLRATGELYLQAGLDLRARLRQSDGATRDLDDHGRAALRHACPFIARGACVIYPVRPLACRGHASHDRRACAVAASGQAIEVPVSEPHRYVRSMVQNALQYSLRMQGYAWAAYELNHALRIALEDEGVEAAWLAGHDVFAPAHAAEVDAAEMAAVFDQISVLASRA